MKKALVLFSGGQDSTTCLGWAQNRFDEVEAIIFDYGQKHKIEILIAMKICSSLNIKYHIFEIPIFTQLADSALVINGNVNSSHSRLKHLPASFVPNRNAMFLTIAHALAQKIGAEKLITGVCETDYSGYPDCRLPFIKKMQDALWVGSDNHIEIITPLMDLTKAQTFELAANECCLGIVLDMSHTCYNGLRTKFEWGHGCNDCPACKLRAKGWKEYKSK